MKKMNATVVVGNPKSGSRTASVATAVAEFILQRCADPPIESEVQLLELAALGPALFDWSDQRLAAAKAVVIESQLLVVASPTYKASITGLLKSFLDLFGRDELSALPTIPVMVGAAPIHHLAVEHALRPVLIEIGACCPTRGLFVVESDLDGLQSALETWWTVWGAVARACVTASRPP